MRDIVRRLSCFSCRVLPIQARGLARLCVALAALCVSAAASAAIPASERQVLIEFYNSTTGAGWTSRTHWRNADDTDFNDAGTECTWRGVTCDAGGWHITQISTPGSNLVGTLPLLAGLTALQDFDVSSNHLTGAIPSLSGLTELQHFYVANNQLTGSIPSLSGLTAMQYFNVSHNQLTGGIPSLSGLTALQVFYAGGNHLIGGIPSLSGLMALKSFDTRNNQLTGSIPSLSGLTALQRFYVSNNQLSGGIPSLSGLTALQEFEVSHNQLTGSIPSLSGLTALQYFYVDDNQLTGGIPSSLSGLTALLGIRVDNNQLTGAAPAVPTPTNNLVPGSSVLCPNQLTQTADAAWDIATGQTPHWYSTCTAALNAQAIINFAVAPTSATVGGQGTLSATGGGSASPVVFRSNTPAICKTWGSNGHTVTYLAIGACIVTADQAGDGSAYNSAPEVRLDITVAGDHLPASERQVLIDLYNSTSGAGWTDRTRWRNAGDTDFNTAGTECAWYGVTCDAGGQHITEINLGYNLMTGTLPSLAGLPALQQFDVSGNHLTGVIPSLSGLRALQYFYAGDNQLTGVIPSLSGLTALRSFDVLSNQLTGGIPSLSGLAALQVFEASANQLTGSIPSLSGLTALQYFYVGNNQLTGVIPSLSGLTALQYFYVGNNQLTGSIPSLSGLSNLYAFIVSNNQLTGEAPAVPAPTNSLGAGHNGLCPNQLTPTANAAWDTATGKTPWYSTCTTALAAQAITNFAVAPTGATVGGQGTLSATGGGSASPVVFGSDTPVICTTSGSNGQTVTYLAAGTCVVTANQAGDGSAYNSAPEVRLNITVAGDHLPASERQVLIDLYNSTGGAGWTDRSRWRNAGDTDFNAAGSECGWYGVACDVGGQHVIGIALYNNNLTGTLPSLTGLPGLKDFNVSSNQLTGSIPLLSGLTALQHFDVDSNQLTGSIPLLSGLTALQYFDVHSNQLTGVIPSLSDLTALQTFYANRNQLTGSIPVLSNLMALQYFYVSDNQLTGAVPAVPAPTNSLKAGFSRLCPNQLTPTDDAGWDTATGQTPHWYSTCTAALSAQAITNFAVAPTGAVVGGYGTLSATGGGSAKPVVFGSNTPTVCTTSGTSGSTVAYVGAGTCIVTADQSGDGTAYNTAPQVSLNITVAGDHLPASERQVLINLYNSTGGAGWTDRTRWRNAGDTDFSAAGTECAWYGVTCDAGGQHVIGIALGYNNLTGALASLAGLTALQYFNVNDNHLTGSIPSLSGLTTLQHIDVDSNQLTGPIPSLSGLTALREFYVDHNLLTGVIPSLSGLTALRGFRVDHNQLTGAAPAVPAPTNSLGAGGSELCPNHLTRTANDAWDTATGSIPWYAACTTAPGAPTLQRLIAGRNQIRVLFQPPADDGGTGVVSYMARCTGNGTTKTASGTGSPLTVTGLTDGVHYTCSVHASNEIGAGIESSALTRAAGSNTTLAPLLLLLGD